MTEENERTRDRFDLSLDGRQIASIVVGALVILGVVFVLGLNVGRQLAARELAAGVGDALAGLEGPPAAPAEPVRHDELTYGEQLTKPAGSDHAERLPVPAPAGPAPAPVTAAATSPGAPDPVLAPPVASAPASAPAAPAAKRAPIPAPPPKTTATAVARSRAPAAPTGSGAWTIQVGSAQEKAEANRLAKRFSRQGARVEVADLAGKGRWYRIRVGRFSTREAAERFLKDLQRETGAKGYVTSAG